MREEWEELLPDEIEQMVARIKAGDTEQFRSLIVHYQRRMHLYCYHMLRSQEDAEDAVQEIFIRCYQQMDKYTNRVSFTAWLYKLAYHHCLNVLKKRTGQHRLFVKIQQQRVEPEPSAESMAATDHLEQLSQALGQLVPEERSLLLLRAIEQHSFEYIADIIGCRPTAARKKYERLRKKLRKHIGDREGELYERAWHSAKGYQ